LVPCRIRQWLCIGRDEYMHIADVWKDRDIRERLLERRKRDWRSYKLHRHVLRDLECLDSFAAQQLSAARGARLPTLGGMNDPD